MSVHVSIDARVITLLFLFTLSQNAIAFLTPVTTVTTTNIHHGALLTMPIAASIQSPTCFRRRQSLQLHHRQLVVLHETAHQTSKTNTKRKTLEEESFVKSSLKQNKLFKDLSKPALQALTNEFEKVSHPRGDVIIQQGNDSSEGNFVFLIDKGKCTVMVDGKVVPDPYGSLLPGAIFGELGVLYNQTRAATILAQTSVVTLFRIEGNAFLDILNKSPEDLAIMKEIDIAINQVEGVNTLYSSGSVVPPFRPERLWLWKQVEGTTIPLSILTTVGTVIISLLFTLYAHYELAAGDVDSIDWSIKAVFQDTLELDKSSVLIQVLSVVSGIWGYQKNLTTFVLTFFLNQAYTFWQNVFHTARHLQARMDDFHLLLATNVKRNDDGTLPPDSQELLDDIGQYSRLFHILAWAAVAKRFKCLATSAGLERMESRGLITAEQLEVLKDLNVPDHELYYAPLEWMIIRTNQARDKGILAEDTSTKGAFLEQSRRLRNDAALAERLDGRMPLAYVHLVQILVDSFVLVAPFALYADLGSYAVFAVAILTFFYTGLLDLAKIFLDPLNNEEFSDVSMSMDLGVLIRESNAGSVRWADSGSRLPFQK